MNDFTKPADIIRLKAVKAKPAVAAKLAALAPAPAPAVIIDIAPRQKAKRQSKPLQERIDRLTDKSAGPNGVWKWLGSLNQSNGYPQISFVDPDTGKRVTRPVHRVLMSLKLGRNLERHEHVMHDRGVPKTDVNPAHMRIGTAQENREDAMAEGRMTGRGKLDVKAILKIVELRHKHHVDVSAIAHRFGVCNRTINDICKGITHSKITGIERVARKPGRPFKRDLKVETKPMRQQSADAATLGAVG